jgi:hypothetical protein
MWFLAAPIETPTRTSRAPHGFDAGRDSVETQAFVPARSTPTLRRS